MKTYYITTQLIYVSVDESDIHCVEFCNHENCISFRAHVYTNALNDNPKSDYLCGVKVKDDVLVKIPTTTPCITF